MDQSSSSTHGSQSRQGSGSSSRSVRQRSWNSESESYEKKSKAVEVLQKLRGDYLVSDDVYTKAKNSLKDSNIDYHVLLAILNQNEKSDIDIAHELKDYVRR